MLLTALHYSPYLLLLYVVFEIDERMFRKLISLNVSNNNIGSLGIRQISLTCKALLSLNIANTLIVDSSLSDIGEGLIQLEELLLDNCVLITDDGK